MNQLTNKTIKNATIAVLGLALSGTLFSAASAQGQINPQSIIVNPVPTSLQVGVFVDRGGNNPVYRIGDPIRVSVNVNQDAYVYLFSVHGNGDVDLILPNRLSGGNEFIRGGETRTFPPRGANYQFNVDGPAGQDKVLAVASKRPLNINEIASFRGGNAFADVQVQGQDNLARALSIVVTPVPQSDWVTAVTYFRVTGGVYSAPKPANPYIFDPLELMLFPGAIIGYRDARDDEAVVEFTTNANLDGVATYYRNAVVSRGFVVRQYRNRPNRVEMRFSGNGGSVNLEIKVQGPRFRLTIEFDR
jgi:hypothetical protein